MASQPTVPETGRRDQKAPGIKAHLDLLFLIAIGLSIPGLLILPVSLLRVPLGLVVLFYIPGHALLKAIYPQGKDLDRFDELALSFGLSVAIMPVLAYLLSLLPWGIRLWPIALSLSVTILFFSGIAVCRRFLSRSTQEYSTSDTQPMRVRHALSGRSKKRYLIGAIALTGLVIAGGVFLILPDLSQRSTEFYVLGEEGRAEDYPREVAPGQPVDLQFGITNREGAETGYRVEVRTNEHLLVQTGEIPVKEGDTWEGKLRFALPQAGDNQPVDIHLFRNQETTIYRHLRLWINVRENP